MPYTRDVDYTDQTGLPISSAQVDSEMDEIYAALNALEAAAGSGVTPTGVVLYTAASTPDTGFLFCDGSAVSRSTYAALFARIGVVHGIGDGSTTFNLPDLRGRTAVHKGTNTSVAALGGSEGAAEPSRSPKHWHTTDSQGNHTHTISSSGVHHHSDIRPDYSNSGDMPFGTSPRFQGQLVGNTSDDGAHTHGASTGGAHTHTAGSSASRPQDGPAYLVLNAQIKT